MLFVQGFWMRLEAMAGFLGDLWLAAVILLAPGIAALLVLLPSRAGNRIAWVGVALLGASALVLPLWRTVFATLGNPEGAIASVGPRAILAALALGFLGAVIAGRGRRLAVSCLAVTGLALYVAAESAARLSLYVFIEEDHFMVGGERVAGVQALEALLRRHPAPDMVSVMWGLDMYVEPEKASPERFEAVKAALLHAGIEIPVVGPGDPRATSDGDIEISVIDAAGL